MRRSVGDARQERRGDSGSTPESRVFRIEEPPHHDSLTVIPVTATRANHNLRVETGIDEI
jgi:hypothetical protein